MSDRFGGFLNKVKSHGDSFYDKVHTAVHEAGDSLQDRFAIKQDPDHTSEHRFHSFAPQRGGNQAKWYVDGCNYFYAVSVALEEARESVWILDWWLSPETYLRRPPATNEEYRLDRMLQKAAERGVKVKVIVYKEVTQALNLSSWHTKHALEDMHPNIAVMRHPDHLPDGMALKQGFIDSFSNLNLTAATASRLGGDALKAIYGMNDGTVLYWAHHEKLCLIDGKIAFMGGLDLCHGRWDTHEHPIADVHPGDLNQILFVGQDYNNARIMDFENVGQWQDNKLNRKWNARMGWSDISVSLAGPVVQDLQSHFTQRWNFIHRDKYDSRKDEDRFHYMDFQASDVQIIPYSDGDSAEQPEGEHHFRDLLRREVEEGRQRVLDHGDLFRQHFSSGQDEAEAGHIPCQIMRSSCKWSSGGSVENSISSAYIETIRDSQHFVYIENQFFITATGDQQKPIRNQIGAAIVERIIRAHNEQQPYKIIVVIPAVPAFPGDLKGDDALSTRAIMEFQYFSIVRGGHSIYEELHKAGIEPEQYIRFYNLRNYDRINISAALQTAEQQSGVDYDTARRGVDHQLGQGFDDHSTSAPSQPDQRAPQSQESGHGEQDRIEAYSRFQSAANGLGSQNGLATGDWDSVAKCAMLLSPPLSAAPWTSPLSELDAFVSEELYVHSKVLIADDRVVICGSANLNDRSQLGTHDSEIAVRIDDPDTVESVMAGQPFRAGRFAASLRRFLFRKHLGLVPAQDPSRCRDSVNAQPVVPGPGPRAANEYDWGSEEDSLVEDPLGSEFATLWEGRARTNTEAFERAFHPVPSDRVRNWREYDEFYGRFFKVEKEAEAEGHDAGRPSTWKWGHVVAEEFSQGEAGVREVREVLGRVKGSLVEMPLRFLEEEDIAKEGMALNAFTEEVYT